MGCSTSAIETSISFHISDNKNRSLNAFNLGAHAIVHDVYGWKFHFHFSYHDGRNDVCSTHKSTLQFKPR